MNGQRLERLPPMALTRDYRLFDTRFRVAFTGEGPLPWIEGMLADLGTAPAA